MAITDDGLWQMTVETIEMLGAERLIHGRIGSSLFTVRLDAMLAPPQIGQSVRLAAAADHLHWFDAQTGQRVAG